MYVFPSNVFASFQLTKSYKYLVGVFSVIVICVSFISIFGLALLYIFSAYFINRHKIGKIEYWCINLFFPFCILFSIFLPLLLRGQAYELADRIFNNRINFAKYFLSMDNISLLGNNLAEITTDIITIDNSFVYVWVIYGIPYFVIMCMVYLMTILRYVTQRKNHELVMICCFLMAGVTEPFLFNTSFKNLTLLFNISSTDAESNHNFK